MKLLKVLFASIFLLVLPARAAFINESSAVFFPHSLSTFADTTQKFSFFWKALLLIENSPEAHSYLAKLCDRLKTEETVSEYYCTPSNFKMDEKVLKEWIQDTPLRQGLPRVGDFQKLASSQLAAASLPGTPREFLTVLRLDPMAESFKLWNLRQGVFSFPSQVNGFFSNSDQSVLAIPFSFVHAPHDLEKTQRFLARLRSFCDESCPRFAVLGPHAAIMTNQNQIIDDLQFVSILGAILFALTMFMMGWKRGAALLALCLPLAIAIGIAVLVTVLVMGSIHGLTLAFGPSLVGLVLDYGIHTKIHKGSSKAWASNLFGLLTTLSGFVALGFSEIPLLRQLMLFAVVGLLSAFVLYYFFSRSKLRLWTHTEFRVFAFDMKPNKIAGAFALLLLVAAFVAFPFMNLDLNLRNFEYRQSFQSQLESQMWSEGRAPEVFFKVNAGSETSNLQKEKEFSFSAQVSYRSWSTYLPDLQTQRENLRSWQDNTCKNIELRDTFAKRFFEPFSALKLCETIPKSSSAAPPAYVADYVSRKNSDLLSVWVPTDKAQRSALMKELPDAISLRSVFESFPNLLLREIAIMFPIGLFMCLALIFYHTRKLKLTLLALVPMFCSVGLVFLTFILLGKSLSFVSCVALLMIFGSSVDYGIFKVDSLREETTRDAEEKVFSSLLMNALLTFVGYLPLVFAKHPVLSDLGWVLSVGTVGAFLGGVWGVSFIAQKIKSEVSL